MGRGLLRLELGELLTPDLNIDPATLGFDPHEIDQILGTQGPDKSTRIEDERLPAIQATAPVSQMRDLWICGPHKLLCGDATKEHSYDALLGNERAQMVFTDPPYNVPVAGHVSGLGTAHHSEFAMASGEMTPPMFRRFLSTALGNIAAYAADGSICFVCMDWRHADVVMAVGSEVFTKF